jgi:toxin HigB-1
MIINFRCKITEDIYNGIDSRYSRRISKDLHAKICRLLDQLNAITKIETLAAPSGNHLEKLKGDLCGYWSLLINNRWRIIFKWDDRNAYDVEIVDYH